jgi:hypothetical protein
MFNLITDNKSIKDIVKEEVFRQYVVGNLLSLCEARINPTNLVYNPKNNKANQLNQSNNDKDSPDVAEPEEIIKKFLLLPKNQKQELIRQTNETFINNLSNYDDFVEYIKEKYGDNQALFITIALYSLGKNSDLPKLKREVYKFYIDFITYFYFKPTSTFFGTKSSFTGNKKVDNAIKKAMYTYFYVLLGGKYSFPNEFKGLDSKITSLIKNNTAFADIKSNLPNLLPNQQPAPQQLPEQINEGFFTNANMSRLIFSINFLLGFNKKTNALIRDVMENISAEEYKKISKGGGSSAAALVTKAVMKRTADELVAINISGDKNIDKMLALIAAYIARENSELNDRIENVIKKLLDDRLQYLKSPNNRLTNLLASFGGYAR